MTKSHQQRQTISRLYPVYDTKYNVVGMSTVTGHGKASRLIGGGSVRWTARGPWGNGWVSTAAPDYAGKENSQLATKAHELAKKREISIEDAETWIISAFTKFSQAGDIRAYNVDEVARYADEMIESLDIGGTDEMLCISGEHCGTRQGCNCNNCKLFRGQA
jgi:hypothetical protein